VGENGLQGVGAIPRTANDGDIAFDLKQSRQRAQDHSLVFCNDDADSLSRGFGWRIQLIPFTRFRLMISV
jgi:hypothetical protein